MIIDFHTHCFPQKIAASTLKKLSEASGIAPFTTGTEDGLLNSMRSSGIDLSVVLPVATNPGQVENINNKAAELCAARQSDGLISFGGIHPDYSDWKAEIHRIARLGLKGIKIHPIYQGVDFDDVRYLRIFSLAAELDLPILTHAGLDIGFPDKNNCSPDMILNAVRQVGPFKLILAHMGGWKSWETAEKLSAEKNIYLDTALALGSLPLQDPEASYWDPQLLNAESFLSFVKAFGAARILFGTDSPWSGQAEGLAWIRALPLPPVEKDMILGGNAKRLLKL